MQNGVFDNVKKRGEDASPRRRRILGRRYPLTKTGYKYLDIGINVAAQSRVEIAIGDNNGREIILTHEVWKNLMRQAATVLSQFNSVDDPQPIQVGPLALRFGRFNNRMLLHLESSALRLSISRETTCNLFNLEYCVDHMVNWLNQHIVIVNEKFKRYSEISASNPATAYRLIRENESFDMNNIIDCELLAQVFAFS